ncbi:myeloid leukemia factor 1-like isoform X2 [Ornithodoros turicata]|uniref:myeloid leukemia factor 1-like isoform X2 n=1 Tax=Ornithodoros turicata TaxID=34597 RepID=UPI0031396F0A
MSLFGSLMRDLDNDPFFGGPMETMRQMEAMMDNMMSPFAPMIGGFPAIGGPMRHAQHAMAPFGGFGRSLFPNVDDMFANFGRIAQDPNCHSYTSSSVMTMTTDEHGRPQVYQASNSTRMAPGGVKETRRSLQDSRSGVQEMAIGHHIGERAHIIGRKRNRRTGEEDENVEFINLDEDEAHTFNQEWQQRVRASSSHQPYQSLPYQRPPYREDQLAIMAGPRHDVREDGANVDARQEPRPKRKSKAKHQRPRHETSM